ncbi:hypothetical protein SAMN05444392_101688 [Seinonella peptonophila]|uniref:Uncharacterized protein n=1 Tax=Seinonella peptonophila TaxID=112248 RepID=A0A1M4TX10_9BACL|nr:hypothetical protein [Seinonella peptonophila]SHE48962.1 hypothetical protein SAMN05444392_101688 [Seinonella peptonophila]
MKKWILTVHMLTIIHLFVYITLVTIYWGEDTAFTKNIMHYFGISIPGFGAISMWALWYQEMKKTGKMALSVLLVAIFLVILFFVNSIIILFYPI